MASQIEQLRSSFDKMSTTQKEQFVNTLKQKLQGSTNAEYIDFLNECVQKYNSAVRGGSIPDNDFDDLLNIGGGCANVAFEKRIEQYKAARYRLKKRNGDTVALVKTSAIWTVLYSVLTICVIVMAVFVDTGFVAISLFLTAIFFLVDNTLFKVTISLSKTGKIEETGNVLKNK